MAFESDQAIAESYGYPDLFETEDLEANSNETCHKVCQWMKVHGGKTPNKRSSDPEEKSFGQWVSHRRKALKVAGTLRKAHTLTFYGSDQDIVKSYGYPDLFETENLEALSNEMCRKVCEWMKVHGKVPSTTSSDNQESRLGRWVALKRSAKQGGFSWTFYESDQAIVESFGCPNLFNLINKEKLSNEKCKEVLEWIKNHDDKIPSTKSSDRVEKLLGEWVVAKRQAKTEKRNQTFYTSDQELAKLYGYPDLFEIEGSEKLSNKKCKEVLEWMKNNGGKYPSAKSTNREEKLLSSWISGKRQSKSRDGKFYYSDQALAESYGYSNFFDVMDYEGLSNDTCKRTCEWIKNHGGKYPSTTSLNSEEKLFGIYVANKRYAKKYPKKSTTVYYSSDQAIANSYGYTDLFDLNREKISNDTCKKVCQWAKEHENKFPREGVKDLNEKILGKWLSHKRGNIKSGKSFYPSDQAIARSYGYPDLFETKKGKL